MDGQITTMFCCAIIPVAGCVKRFVNAPAEQEKGRRHLSQDLINMFVVCGEHTLSWLNEMVTFSFRVPVGLGSIVVAIIRSPIFSLSNDILRKKR